MNCNKIEKVKSFVELLFDGMVDKGGHPYVNHILAVVEGVCTTEEKIVAVLHDVLEDTDLTDDDLVTLGIPKHLICSIIRLTKSKSETYVEYINSLLNSGDLIALKVKKSDLENNMDISRIPKPTQKDYDRIEKRYKPAYSKVCNKINELNNYIIKRKQNK